MRETSLGMAKCGIMMAENAARLLQKKNTVMKVISCRGRWEGRGGAATVTSLFVVSRLHDSFPTRSSGVRSSGPRGLVRSSNEAPARNNDNKRTPLSIHPGQESKYIHRLISKHPGKSSRLCSSRAS